MTMKHALLIGVIVTLPHATSALASDDSSCTVHAYYCENSKDLAHTSRVVARAYNGDDTVYIAAADDATVEYGHSASLTCTGDSNCKVAVEVYDAIADASTHYSVDCGETLYVATKGCSGRYCYASSTSSCDAIDSDYLSD